MAYGDFASDTGLGNLSAYLAPIMSSDKDPDEVLAAKDPRAALAGLTSTPASVKSALASTQPSSPITGVSRPPNDGVVDSTASALAPKQPIMPATNAANTPSEQVKSGPQAVPSIVQPSGSQQPQSSFSDISRQAASGALQSLGEANQLASQRSPVDISKLEQARATTAAAKPVVTDPNHPEYQPSLGRRIARGVLGSVAGLAERGLGGAVVGAISPQSTTGVGYKSGTSAFNRATQANAQQLANLDQQLQQADTQAKTKDQAVQDKLAIAKAQAGLVGQEAREGTAESKQNNEADVLAKAGLHRVQDPNDSSKSTIEDDPNSSVYQARKAMTDLRQAQSDNAEAQAELRRAGNDPNSPAYKLAKQKAATASGNMNAAQERAQAYMMNSLSGTRGVDLQGNALPGTTQTETGAPVGSHFQSQYSKNVGQTAQFNDVHGALDNLEKAASAMKAKGERPDNALVAAALAQPKGTVGQWLQGQVAKGNLTPTGRDWVTGLVSARENLQALRKSTGGGVSDSQVDRLIDMLPNQSTPDWDYAARQINQIRSTANRLGEGIPKTTGGPQLRNRQTTQGGPPASVVQGAKEGQYLHGPNGEVYRKINGQAVQQK